MKLTPWFPGDVKPVREGVYERFWCEGDSPNYSYWNGSSWGLLTDTPTQARRNMRHVSAWQDMPWRGVEK